MKDLAEPDVTPLTRARLSFAVHGEEFLTELLNAGRSEATAKAYRYRFHLFEDWLSSSGIRLEAVTRDTLQQYLSDMRVQGCAPKYVRDRIAVIKTFFAWLIEEKDLALRNPARRIEVKVPRRLPRILDEDDARELMEAAKPGRERVTCELLYGSGVRAAELLGIDLDDVDLKAGEVRIVGKGGDEALQPITPQAVSAIREWLSIRAQYLLVVRERATVAQRFRADGVSFRSIAMRLGISVTVAFKWATRPMPEEEPALLIGRQGRLSASQLRNILIEVASRTSIDKRVYPHLLRHCYATHLLNGGADLRAVQELMRHKKLETTQIYTHVSRNRLKQEFARCHPRFGATQEGGHS